MLLLFALLVALCAPLAAFRQLATRRLLSLRLQASLLPQEPAAATASNTTTAAYSPIPRLNPDMGGLVKWVEKVGGKVSSAQIIDTPSGWRLHNTVEREMQPGETLVEVPKKICIFSDGDKGDSLPLLENACQLMNALDKKQWRVRLAIALLSERVRPSSAFRAYIRNLPFEFRGMPLFFSSSEFGLLQDIGLSASTKARCAFLSDFEEAVLKQLHKSPGDPFSGHKADLNAFGWGFATAASRANRHPNVTAAGGPVLIPILDVPWHSFDPNCEVVDVGSFFALRAKRPVAPGEELTIDYGALSNEELLEDYGFTVDGNPNDRVLTSIEFPLVALARVCMGQRGEPMDGEEEADGAAVRGALADRWLRGWQAQWLRVLRLYGDEADYGMTLRSSQSLAGVDGRLWAFLRVLYARSEDDLLSHGYDPFSLQSCASMLGAEQECDVLKTLIGLHAIVLRVYGPDLDDDIHALKNNVSPLVDGGAVAGRRTRHFASDDIVDDVHRLLRLVFQIEQPLPASPTVRLAKEKAAGAEKQLSVEDLIRQDAEGGAEASIGSGYAIAGAEGARGGASDSSPAAAAGKDAAAALGASLFSEDDVFFPLDECGLQLPLNVQVALRYRIRRKRALCNSIRQLASAYRRLRAQQGLPDDIALSLAGAPASVSRQDRITKIRELLDHPEAGAGDGALLVSAKALSVKWSRSSTAL